jgi:hypothetical protein
MDIHDVVGNFFRLFFDPRPVDVGVAMGAKWHWGFYL